MIMALKKFVKKCKNTNLHTRKMDIRIMNEDVKVIYYYYKILK